MWLRQMAQLSTTMSHAHKATAFHYSLSAQTSMHNLVPIRIYLFDFKTLLAVGGVTARNSLGHFGFRWPRGISHLNVRHDVW